MTRVLPGAEGCDSDVLEPSYVTLMVQPRHLDLAHLRFTEEFRFP